MIHQDAKKMPLPLPQKTTTSSVQTEVARLLQGVIPVLDALHTFPFHNSWLKDSPGQEYMDLMRALEKWLLWLWQKLEKNNPAHVKQTVIFWDSQQTRQHDGMLQRYYRFYEALAAWFQESAGDSKKGGWTGYIGFLLNHEPHLLARHWAGTASPPKEELELIAEQYLYQMQQVHDLDPHLLCLDFFVLMGVFTRKSYFIPHLTFASMQEESSPPQFFDRLKNTKNWSEQASDYLDWLQNRRKVFP